MLFCPAALPLSRRTFSYPPGSSTATASRSAGQAGQALLVLAYLRKGETFAELATGFGFGLATAWRYVTMTVALLATPGAGDGPRPAIVARPPGL